MAPWMQLLLTILCALAVGYVLDRIHLPGGISDIPMIAADLGADPSVVVTMQFIRLVLGIGCFPLMILITSRHGIRISAGFTTVFI